MSGCSSVRNPLVRNGTSQSERLLKALLPSSIKIDEKSIEDTIAFVYKYAQSIKYYDRDNQNTENWQGLLEVSITVLLALISIAPYKTTENDILSLFDDFAQSSTSTDVKAITDSIFGIASEIQSWNKRVPPIHTLKSFILEEIENQLQTPLTTLAQIDKSISVVSDYSDFYTNDWGFDEAAFNGLATKPTDNGSDLESMFDDLKRVYSIFFQSYAKITLKAKELFQSSIMEKDDHPPHITLLICFLFLFQYAKDALNTLTKRHLDFYYQEVLCLKKNEQVPDKVHLLFELAENYSSYRLAKGTTLKAGKDAEGNPLSYELTEETIVNKATVDQLKTVYIDPNANYKVYAASKANSADGQGEEFETDSIGSWRPFGDTDIPKAKVGIAIASPILLLNEGDRTITVTFNLNLDDTASLTSLQDGFTVELSSDESWLEIEEYLPLDDRDEKSGFEVLEIAQEKALRFVIQLHSGDPAIVPFNDSVLEGGFDTVWPVLRIYLNEESENSNEESENSAYGDLKDRTIQTIKIDVDCEGVRNLILQNDQTVFALDKAFHPFGPRPSIGSNFYIGSEEVFSKKLNTLSLIIEWLDLPPSGDFEKHYCVYNSILNQDIKNDSFKVKVSYLKNKIWNPLFDNNGQNLFAQPSAGFQFFYFPISWVYGYSSIWEAGNTNISLSKDVSHTELLLDEAHIGENDATYLRCKLDEEDGEEDTINISTIDLNAGDNGVADFDRYEGILSLDTYNSNTQRGFIRLQLSGKDFQHTKYSEVYTKQALKLANGLTDETTTIFPNEPYTPTIKSLYLGYSSSVEIEFSSSTSTKDENNPPSDNAKSRYDSRTEQAFHIYPFGQREVHPYLDGGVILAVPQFNLDTVLCTGHLCIGIKDALPSQIVSLLFQVYEGSGDPEKEVPDIEWLYLKDNQWYPFAASDILEDTTNNLVKSGIIRFLLPDDIVSGNTLLDESCLWIAGCIKETDETDAFPDLIDVKAQAAIASFKDNNNAASHLESALPAETISKLSQQTTAIKSVMQPYASFGGKTQENNKDFYRRISERLRHKNRAITIWDYERLVLQEFPSIHRVKCLNHTNINTEIAPGYVMIVVIPDLRNKKAVDVMEPKVDVGTLEGIRDFLAGINTPFVKGREENIPDFAKERLKVLNPLYEQVRVTVKVKMKKNYDPQYYKKVLNDDLKRFLSPWAYDGSAEIGFGTTLHRSVILNFIEKREYVDFLTDLVLGHYKGGTFLGYKEEIQTTSARSILTSYSTVDISTGLEHSISTDAGCSSS
ncbi:MAG: baseplate J/gp47 family protein [Thermodesulfobacteriota bacterium]|nr:baseplate J/gp47 family protein [Thermodesulfobacteriota bacterium]